MILDFLLQASALTPVLNLDEQVFLAIHNGTANSLFDSLMPIIRNKLTWIPLYLFFIGVAIYKYQLKAIYFILAAAMCVFFADQLSATIIKPWAERLRPCNQPHLADQIRDLVHCGQGYSFISSHATNHFALATFFTFFFKQVSGMTCVKYVFYIWASLIAFAQVYVGVHFPIDVIVGAFIGITIGYIIVRLAKNYGPKENHLAQAK